MASMVLALLLLVWAPGASDSLQAQEPDPVPGVNQTFHLWLPALGGRDVTEVGDRQMQAGWPAGRLYTIRTGDTLLTVALEMGVDLEDMACLLSPTFRWSQPLVIGNTLAIPEAPFICHQVREGENLDAVAERYGVDPLRILAEAWNGLDGDDLISGNYLRISLALPEPPDEAPVSVGSSNLEATSGLTHSFPMGPAIPDDWPYGSGIFRWPAYGWLTQGYRIGHSAVDIAAPLGSPVTAADRGVVIRAGWSSVGYGKFVVIDHNIDYLTLYAHLSEILVEPGQVVAQGQLIGRVGSTGNSTGPHLHFEIRDFGRRIDPLSLLTP